MKHAFDIETFSNNLIPFCIIIKIQRYFVFYSNKVIDDFITFLGARVPSNTFLYAHNLSFDGGLLLQHLPTSVNIDPLSFLLKNGDIYGFTLIINNKFFHFRCSYKLLPLSLKDVGLLLDCNKFEAPETPLTYAQLFNDSSKTLFINYCKQDVNILTLFLIALAHLNLSLQKN